MINREFGNEAEEGKIQLPELVKSIIGQAVYFGFAMITASASSQKYFSPLGIAFATGVDRENTLFACLGAMAGYVISNDYISAFRYVMALILVYILRVYVNTFPKLRKKTFVPAGISLFATISTGLVSMLSETITVNLVFLRISEALVAFGGAYFFAVSVWTLEKLNKDEEITSKEIMSLSVGLLVLIISLSELSVFGVTLSGIACSYVVMASSYLFKESGGALLGTGASLVFLKSREGHFWAQVLLLVSQ